jgi:hypothetical protein
LADEIGNHQNDDEDAGEEIVVLEGLRAFCQSPIIEDAA